MNRKLRENNNGWSLRGMLFDGAPFVAQLIKSIILQRGTGSPTFTRATTKSGQKYDPAGNLLFTALSGEAVFSGARRVRNLLTFTEDLTNAAWGTAGVTVAGTRAVYAPRTPPLTKITEIAAATIPRISHSIVTAVVGRTYIQSLYAKAAERTQLRLVLEGSGGFAAYFDLAAGTLGIVGGSCTATIEDKGGGVYRCSVKWTATATTTTAYYATASGGTVVVSGDDTKGIYLGGDQLEDITGRADQTTPSEYVSVDALIHNSQDPLYYSTPGTAGHYASGTSANFIPAAGITTFIFDGAATDWSPVGEMAVLSQYQAPGVQGCFDLTIIGSGVNTQLRLYGSTDGATLLTGGLSTAFPLVDTARVKVAATHTSSTGAIAYYYSINGGATWIAAGTSSIAAGVLFDSSSAIEVGSVFLGAATRFAGNVYGAQIYAGDFILAPGSAVLKADFNPMRDATTPTGTITSSTTGEVWTLNGASSVVRSACYHGSMVDGVKCFDTDLSGNPIASSSLLGYLAEPAATNLCLQSNGLATAPWASAGTATATQNAVGPNGQANYAWTITDPDAAIASYKQQIATLTAATYTQQVKVKKTTGAQANYPVFFAYSVAAGQIAMCTIDTTNGVVTTWTAYTGLTISTSSSTCVSYNQDFWLVTLKFLATANPWEICALPPAGTANATQSTGAVVGTLTGSHVACDFHLETGSTATSYIPTTTIAVARNADVLTYPSAGNVSDTAGTIYCEAAYASVGGAEIIAGSTGLPLQLNGGALQIYDGTNSAQQNVAVTSTPVKLAAQWGTTKSNFVNSVVSGGGSSAFDGSMNLGANLGIGTTPAGTLQVIGNIRNLRIWPRALSNSELQAVTKP